MDALVAKLQFDLTGSSLLITEVPCGTILTTMTGADARRVADTYGLTPLTKTYVDAEVDANGLLYLGKEIEEP